MSHRQQFGFSLLELSIVVVIASLLAGAVLTGRSLIRAAELRSVAADAEKYIGAVGAFRNQYGGVPGDIINASRHLTGAADGNGDGEVQGAERFQFWHHLNLAGMIEKKVTGAAGGGGSEDFVMGTANGNVPDSRYKKSGFSAYFFRQTAADTNIYQQEYGNIIAFGQAVGVNAGPPIRASLEPADAYNLDVKMDDGVANGGKWFAQMVGAAAMGATGCSTAVGAYNVNLEGELCGFFIKTGF